MAFVPDQQPITSRFVPDSGGPPQMFVPSGEKTLPSLTSPEGIAGNPATRVALGAASPLIGAAQLQMNYNPIARMIGADKVVNEKLAQLESAVKEGRKQFDTNPNSMDWMQAIGTTFSPAIIGMAKAIPGGLNYLQKVIAGAVGGAAAGASAPITSGANDGQFAKEKTVQTGTGAAVGGAVAAATPVVEGIGKAAYHGLIEPWANPAAIKGRALLEAAGNKTDEIINLLRQNKEIVPGSAPTAGEAAVPAASAEFSALQRSAAGVQPSEYLARSDQQNAARLAAIRSVGKDQAAIESAQRVREAAASPLYRAAREGTAPVDTSRITDRISMILEKNPGNRELVNELGNIQKGLSEAGSDPQKVASVVDGLKATLANKDNAFIKSTLTSIKNDLSNAIPGYQRAQEVFAKASAPINQMQIGQYLEKKLTPALSDEAKQKAAAYAGAVQDAAGTIKRSTGAPRFDELTQVLTPQQMQAVNSVRDDLARSARFEDMAKRGNAVGPSAMDIASQSMQKPIGGPIPALLTRVMMATHTIIDRAGGAIDRKLAAQLATEMLNPPKVAESMAQAKTRAAVNALIARDAEQAISQGTFGAAQVSAKENK